MLVIGIPKGEDKTKQNKFEDIMAENIPKLVINTKTQIQEAQK